MLNKAWLLTFARLFATFDAPGPVILSIVQAVQEADDFALDCLRITLIAQWHIDPTLLDGSVNLVAPPDGVRRTNRRLTSEDVHFYRLRKECFTSTMKLVIENFKKLFAVH